MRENDLRNILFEASTAELGIIVSTNSPRRLSNELNKLRTKIKKTEGITDFDNLTFRTSPSNPDAEVWIVNKEAQDAKARSEPNQEND